MMRDLLEYSGITAKIHGMNKKLFSNKAYKELANLTSIQEAVLYLKAHPGYAQFFLTVDESGLHRRNIEQILYNSIFASFTKIYKFSAVNQRKYLDLYFKRYEVSILKTCLRSVFDQRDIELELNLYKDFFERHSKINIQKVTASNTIEELVNNLKDTEYYAPLNQLDHMNQPTLFDYEMALDLYYFADLWKGKNKLLKKKDLEIITKDQGSKCDILNIMWIYRATKYYHMSNAEVYAILIPVHYKLKQRDLSAMVEANNVDEFRNVLERTYYGRHMDKLISDDMSSLDNMYRNIRNKLHNSEARNYPYSIASINTYLYRKENEVDKITSILEGIRYQIEANQIIHYTINEIKGGV